MNASISISEHPYEELRQSILAALTEFNAAQGYPPDADLLAVSLTDQAGNIVGGLWGKTVYDWLFVDYLVVPPAMRGQNLGSRLMNLAEGVALKRGCVGSWLTTFSFQAQEFYEKLGYEVFGTLENAPRDNVRIFLRKRFKSE